MSDSPNAFADIPPTPRAHLGLAFYEAAFLVICHVRARAAAAGKNLESVFEEFPFLTSYFAELRPRLPEDINWATSVTWVRGQIERWEAEVVDWLPLLALRNELNLKREVLLAFVLLGLVEEESHFAALFAQLQQPGGQRRPTLGLVHAILEAEGAARTADAWEVSRALLDSGLVEAVNCEAPRAEWILRVSPPLWSAARGDRLEEPVPGTRFHAADSLSPLSELVLRAEQSVKLAALLPLLSSGRTRLLVLRGMPGSDRLGVVGAVARGLGRGLLEIHDAIGPRDPRWRMLGPLCTLTRSMPVFCLDLTAEETFELPSISGYIGPIAAILGREGGLAGAGVDSSTTIHLEPESANERLQLWHRALNGHPAENLPAIAEQFLLPGRYLQQAAQIAKACAALDHRQAISSEDVRQATRTLNRQQLDALATPLSAEGGWGNLVVSPSTAADLAGLERRCRHRERLSTTFGEGIPGGLNRGVRALFEGPSGTGKTLAARVLASALGLDLYRVDLAAVVNKYIGETEKNLSRVLARAEDLDVILLLDEGDALMTRRTEVKSANDRYANLETNYLLQRLETYTGIVLVTTNAGHSIDSAFRRRMDVVVKFHLPDPGQRWQLWLLHLPQEHAVSPPALEEIALRFALTGGQVRNAAVHAALLSVERGSLRVSETDLRSAIQVEYRKAGASFPRDASASGDTSHVSLGGFLRAIS